MGMDAEIKTHDSFFGQVGRVDAYMSRHDWMHQPLYHFNGPDAHKKKPPIFNYNIGGLYVK